MGTNYYTIPRKRSICQEVKHIGKSSYGWKFLFRGYEEENIRNVEDWKKYIKENDLLILDEYDDEISFEDFFKLVEEKQKENNKDDFKYSLNVEGYRFTYNNFM